jgi:hypothetical protein
MRQADPSSADTSPDKVHQSHGDEAEHAANDGVGHALFRDSACPPRGNDSAKADQKIRSPAAGLLIEYVINQLKPNARRYGRTPKPANFFNAADGA